MIGWLTNSMEQTPSWEANQFSVSQEIPHILWKPLSKAPATLRPYPTSWKSFLILPSYLRPDPPSGLFPSVLPTNILYLSLLSLLRATYPAHLIIFM